MVEYLGKVLIVDDDPTILRTFSKILLKKGYSVVSHETGKEAINDKTAYDVALIDYKLADMEGTSVAADISANTTFIISGFPSEDLNRKAKAVGVNAIYSKPIKIELLLSDIEKAIAKKKQ
jgi:CheY-like chemotaxis protein